MCCAKAKAKKERQHQLEKRGIMFQVEIEAGNTQSVKYMTETFEEAINIFKNPVSKIATDLYKLPAPFIIKLISSSDDYEYDGTTPYAEIVDVKIWRP